MPHTTAQPLRGDQITVFIVTSWSPSLLVKKGLLYLVGDRHLRRSPRAGKRFYSLAVYIRMSDACIHVDHNGPLKFGGQGFCL
uniref:Macaca fascicularis brain cDNA, clone: QmoA-10903 n=1 Tax=Macaca fascicularis TaxID=9541 RepID=I7GH68_MACFA|nr:unnamed protein product [Macaca fascicularis]